MASVATEGFRELAAQLRSAVDRADPVVSVGLAYLEFALAKRGLFRLMFGPLLAQRRTYPALHAAAVEAFAIIERAGLVDAQAERREDTQALAAWGLIHGLASLFIENVVPAQDAKRIAQQVLAHAGRSTEKDSASA